MPIPKLFRNEFEADILFVTLLRNLGGLEEAEVQRELNALFAALDEHGTNDVIFDLGSIEYFGSAMLELMVAVWNRVKQEHGKIAICNASEAGMEVLSIAKFDTIWPICETREDAVARIRE